MLHEDELRALGAPLRGRRRVRNKATPKKKKKKKKKKKTRGTNAAAAAAAEQAAAASGADDDGDAAGGGPPQTEACAELAEAPSAATFLEYVAANAPVVLRGVVATGPCSRAFGSYS